MGLPLFTQQIILNLLFTVLFTIKCMTHLIRKKDGYTVIRIEIERFTASIIMFLLYIKKK